MGALEIALLIFIAIVVIASGIGFYVSNKQDDNEEK